MKLNKLLLIPTALVAVTPIIATSCSDKEIFEGFSSIKTSFDVVEAKSGAEHEMGHIYFNINATHLIKTCKINIMLNSSEVTSNVKYIINSNRVKIDAGISASSVSSTNIYYGGIVLTAVDDSTWLVNFEATSTIEKRGDQFNPYYVVTAFNITKYYDPTKE